MEKISLGSVITGQVTSKVPGGLRVDFDGVNVLLPEAEIDIRPVADIGEYVGRTVQCEVTQIDPSGANIVVSRRSLIERQRQEDTTAVLGELQAAIQTDSFPLQLTDVGIDYDATWKATVGSVPSLDEHNATIAKLVEWWIWDSFGSRATQLHLNALANRCEVSYLVGGIPTIRGALPLWLLGPIVAYLRRLSNLAAAATEGPLQLSVMGGRPLDFELHLLPTPYGESITIVLEPAAAATPGDRRKSFWT
jgi:type II secretory ATPase GspE/PulE/Tfp pilus assembly ATPase PilB-like protein